MSLATTRKFEYSGRTVDGKLVKGKLEAPNESVVATRIRSMGLYPVTITAASNTGLSREINLGGFGKGVKLKDLAVMSRQLATMISAGLTLLRALTILSEQTENATLARTLSDVRTDVENGSALSAGLTKHPTVFPPLMIHLVRAGEAGGFLEGALDSIAVNYEGEVKLRGTIKSALTYPVVVFLMAMVSVVGMLIFIVPVFKKMFEDMGAELPLPTQILVVLSSMLIWLAPLLIIVGIVFSIWWSKNKHTDRVRMVKDPLMLKLPVFGDLFRKVSIARFSRNFSTMMGAGVPILQSLSIVGETSGNWPIEEALRNVADAVRSGQSIAGPLSREKVFPPMVTQMVAVGEDAGALQQMLEKIADFYDSEVQATTEALTALIEPLMIAFIGVVIGGMIVALYMPIFTIFDAIK